MSIWACQNVYVNIIWVCQYVNMSMWKWLYEYVYVNKGM
jgi:hypothetical protein